MRRKKKQISLLMTLFLVIFGSIFYFLEPSQANPNTPTPTPEIVQANQEIQDGEKLQIWFLDVGQADSILIQNGDANMLIDAGNNEDGKKRFLFSKFRNRNIPIRHRYACSRRSHRRHG